ncbi:MAG: GGDEF domain-containing protein [Nanoarchaeota archaeon]
MKREIKNFNKFDLKLIKEIQNSFEKMHSSISLLYNLAIHDEKTGLYNNRFYENQLDFEIEKTQRKKRNLSLIMTDIDFFKKINDEYGHIKGDEILAKLAKVINSQIRKYDIASRFGGEEFAIILPETTSEKAKILARRLQKAVEKDSFLKKYKLTLSIGITQFKSKDSKKSFKIRADKALYQAKKSGRNKFVVI